jgi:uncharacterized protein with HEPN domain
MARLPDERGVAALRTDRLFLGDILDAIEEIISATPASKAEFDAHKMVRSHIVRNIQIIGEAASRLSKPLKSDHPAVSWRLIAGMRHAIVHDYYKVDWDEVYRTAVADIPPLRT